MSRIFGIDGGSVSIKIAMLGEGGEVIHAQYRRHRGHPLNTLLELLREFVNRYGEGSVAFTGSTGRAIAESVGAPVVNELIAHVIATKRFNPEVNTIFEMGGEDSKLIITDGESVRDFSLNSVCAAGTGSFLDQQAERLRLSVEEFAEMAMKSEKPPRVAGRCSVFAKSDMIHLQQIATPLEDIVAGLCFAVARNFRGAIVRGRVLVPEISFQGGVALNQGMVRAFREVFGLDRLVVPEYTALMGAIGAALKAMEEGLGVPLEIKTIEDVLSEWGYSVLGQGPLVVKNDGFRERHPDAVSDSEFSDKNRASIAGSPEPVRAYIGIDIGSISTNLAVIGEDGGLISKRYLMTAGRPIEAVRQGLREISSELPDNVLICGAGTTGSGRYMIADFVGADIVKNEITAQATASAFIDPLVDTIFEIGGQDSKYISLRDGVIVDFEMNKACAAGTGSFLEEQAEKLDISIKGEFAECAFSSESPCRLGERCTVFMENSLMANLQRGVRKNDLLAGLAYSIVENYINRVVAGRKIGDKIFFQGGTAFNKSVVAAFEKFLGKEIIVPPNHDVTGAIGMAMIARDYVREKGLEKSLFKGFALADRPYQQSSFECKGCENMCEINRIRIEGEKGHLFYGGRCEKYDIRRKRRSDLPDLFSFRREILLQSHNEYLNSSPRQRKGRSRGRIGVPYIFYFHDYLPYWSTLLWELGFDVVLSPETNRGVVNLGVETVLAETCFPVKVAHGHVRFLLEEGIKRLFIPSFVNMSPENGPYEKGHACPLTQSFPYQIRVAFKEVDLLCPVVSLKDGDNAVYRELKRCLGRLGVGSSELRKAMKKAGDAQNEFFRRIRQKGQEVLQGIDRDTVVIVGRTYNAFDMGMNLEIPSKLATLDMMAIPMDFLPEREIYQDWPEMYWRSGQRILQAARYIRENRFLYPIFIGNFSCGPDSFIQKYFEEELSGRPYLHIEIDEHSADVGAITRCEAFLDSISAQNIAGYREERVRYIPRRFDAFVRSGSNGKRMIYIPRMSDHAFAIESAFQYCGVSAEVLPETDQEAISIGRRYVSGKECYPCAVTTGDMLRKAFSPGFRPGESAFFMPSGTGPCRFGQYNLFHRMVLDGIGMEDVPIFSPVQDVTFYKDLGLVGNDFIKRSWEGVVAYDLLLKCLHETRPYEKERGAADSLYGKYLDRLRSALKISGGGLFQAISDMRRDFEGIQGGGDEKPLIGIVGEIFVRSNRFSNEDLVRRIESLGGEVWLSPVDEWIYYINLMSLKKFLLKKDGSGIIQFFLKRIYQKRISRRFESPFEGFLKSLHEPYTGKIMKKASPYLHESFEGEAILSIGKSIDMIERGAAGVVNAMPFGCMPGTVVTALMRGVSELYGVPFISIPYDGTDSPTTQLQLEAFMEQAKKRKLDRGKNRDQ
ncbi:R-phenyllactate dehydratase activator [bacterium BMS3Bbin06]|nr:R-phenyllactate dehydratase activator [bacterium BMS3Bbin06]